MEPMLNFFFLWDQFGAGRWSLELNSTVVMLGVINVNNDCTASLSR